MTTNYDFFDSIWKDDSGIRFISSCDPRNERSWGNYPFETTEAATEFAAAEIERGMDVYFGVHLFDGQTRKASSAKSCRALYLDIDVGSGKPYKDKSDAVEAVQKMIEGAGMPTPTIVDSGRGIHLYWILSQAADQRTWAVMASQVEAVCKAQGLKVDGSVTKDRARVMRCPGSSNRKDEGDPKPCSVLLLQPPIELTSLCSILDKATPALQYDNASEINDPFMAGLENGSEFSKSAAKLCLRFITGEHVTEYGDWMRVGFALWNTFGGSNEGLQLWDDVSAKSANYKPGVCHSKWETMAEFDSDKATVGTLHQMAKESAGEIFLREWRSEVLILKASEIGCTDVGNARRLVTLHGENIRYDYSRRLWYAWTGTYWKEDAGAEVMRFAMDTARNILSEAAKTENDAKRKELITWAKSSEAAFHLQKMVSLASVAEEIQANISDFDPNPHLLCVENGVIDLKTRMLQPHNRDLMITCCLPIRYDPAAECPIFDAFLDRIFDGDSELTEYVLRALGYAITGENSEHVLFMCYGEGANGKSTLIETIHFILGDLAGTVRTEALMQDKFGGNSGHNDDIANLHGKRFVSAAEGESGQRFAESRIKQLVGGDTISASRKYGRAFQFQPIFTLFFATNHKPQISGTDEGIWRRIRLIPFGVCIPEYERDPDLKVKLQSEAVGILARLVRAASHWYAKGLGKEPDVIDATAGYRKEQDTVENFLYEMCDCDPGLTAVPGILFDQYRQWCIDNGLEPLNRQAFPAELKKKGFEKRPMKWLNQQTRTLWQGIGLRNAFAATVSSMN